METRKRVVFFSFFLSFIQIFFFIIILSSKKRQIDLLLRQSNRVDRILFDVLSSVQDSSN